MKILKISDCNECPYFKTHPIHHEDNRYLAVCTATEENSEWTERIGRNVPPPKLCPLPDYIEPED